MTDEIDVKASLLLVGGVSSYFYSLSKTIAYGRMQALQNS